MSAKETKKTQIKQLCYVSFLADGLNAEEVIKSIKEVSQRKNQKYGLTGQLLFSHEIFIQILEGEPLNVDLTYRIIQNDERHNNPYILFDQKSEERCFPDWTMKFNSVKKIDLVSINKILHLANDAKELDYFSNEQIKDLFTDFIEASN